MRATLLSLICLCVSVVSTVEAATPCHICGDAGNGAMAFPNVVLANVGKTCTQISLDVALNVPLGSSTCRAKQNEWAGRCCNPRQRPAGREPSNGLPPQNIPSVQWVGPHPPCSICRDGDYPYATSMVINFLYIGEGSCAQYYKYGLEGRIQQHMCDPVKFFSYEPCGCGEFNPYFNPNHPLNQQAQQAPSTGGGSGGGNNGGNNGGSNGGGNSGGIQQQRVPQDSSGKDCVKMSNSYGGSGACAHSGGRRGLKGSKANTATNDANTESNTNSDSGVQVNVLETVEVA